MDKDHKMKQVIKQVMDVVGEEEVKEIKKKIIPNKIQIKNHKILHNQKFKKTLKKDKIIVQAKELQKLKKRKNLKKILINTHKNLQNNKKINQNHMEIIFRNLMVLFKINNLNKVQKKLKKLNKTNLKINRPLQNQE